MQLASVAGRAGRAWLTVRVVGVHVRVRVRVHHVARHLTRHAQVFLHGGQRLGGEGFGVGVRALASFVHEQFLHLLMVFDARILDVLAVEGCAGEFHHLGHQRLMLRVGRRATSRPLSPPLASTPD